MFRREILFRREMEKIADNMTEIECDVVVVGAGFGGAAAAKKCADAGLKTIMIERSENVGDKIISGLTIPFHGFLFGPDFIRDGNPPIERPVDGIVNYIIKDIENNDIDIDDSLKVPKPFSPIFSHWDIMPFARLFVSGRYSRRLHPELNCEPQPRLWMSFVTMATSAV